MKQYKTLLFFFCYFSVISPHIQHSISKKYMKLNEYCDYLGAIILFTGFLGGTSGKEPSCQCSRHKGRGFDPWIGKIPWRGACNPLQYSCLENPVDREARWATVIRSQRVGRY